MNEVIHTNICKIVRRQLYSDIRLPKNRCLTCTGIQYILYIFNCKGLIDKLCHIFVS